MSDLKMILTRAVPDYAAARKSKINFRDYPIRTDGAHNDEPLVDIAEYGIAGQSYYSRPNAATGDPVAGIATKVCVRRSIAERLSALNYALQQPDEVAELLGGKVELYVNEGYRSAEMQRQLYEVVFPKLIREQHPEFSDKEVLARRDQLVSAPPSKDSPSPHATGAAVDVRLRYAQAELGFVADSDVLMAHKRADMSQAANPDCFEHLTKLIKKDKEIQKNRRVFYWIMRGALIDDDSCFVVNPTEWWHWSYGDQLWAEQTNAPEAFFSFAEAPAD
jgi:D-alanyl-D-alanine dipeptidase